MSAKDTSTRTRRLAIDTHRPAISQLQQCFHQVLGSPPPATSWKTLSCRRNHPWQGLEPTQPGSTLIHPWSALRCEYPRLGHTAHGPEHGPAVRLNRASSSFVHRQKITILFLIKVQVIQVAIPEHKQESVRWFRIDNHGLVAHLGVCWMVFQLDSVASCSVPGAPLAVMLAAVAIKAMSSS